MMKTKSILVCFVSILFIFASVAYAKPMRGMGRDKVIYRVTAEQWVKTKSAVVFVNISATMSRAGLAQARTEMLGNLQRIAKATWHITQFNRSQDSSGLERLSVQAQARVPEGQLANLRSSAKSVSKPGATYRVTNINFTPSLAEVSQVRAKVRDELYKKITQELARLNKIYPQQKFEVHRVNFIPGMGVRRMPYAAKRTMSLAAMPATDAAPILVSNKVKLMATVVLASSKPKSKSS